MGILAGGESKVLKRRDFLECGDKKKQILDRFYPVAYTRNGKPFYVKPTTVYFRFSLSPFPDEKTVETSCHHECANIGRGTGTATRSTNVLSIKKN